MKNSTHVLQCNQAHTLQSEDVMNDRGCHTIYRIKLIENNIQWKNFSFTVAQLKTNNIHELFAEIG